MGIGTHSIGTTRQCESTLSPASGLFKVDEVNLKVIEFNCISMGIDQDGAGNFSARIDGQWSAGSRPSSLFVGPNHRRLMGHQGQDFGRPRSRLVHSHLIELNCNWIFF